MIWKLYTRAVNAWRDSTFHAYVVTLLEVTSWRVALALALMLFRSVSQGAQLLLLIPLMQLVGLTVQQGYVGRLAKLIRSGFEAMGASLTPTTVLGAFVFFTIVLALITRWQSIFNFKLQQDFTARLRQRLYRAIANTNWLAFSKARSSDFTHALTTELERVGAATAFLLQLLAGLALVPIYVVLALKISATMTALVFVSGAALLLLLRGRTRAARRIGEETSQATSGLYSAAIEHLGGMKAVKSYGAEERSAGVFSALNERVVQTYLDANRNYAGTAFWFSVGSATILSAILLVSLEFLSLPATSLLFLLVLFNRMIPLFSSIQRNHQMFSNALPAFARTMEMKARCETAAEPKAESHKMVELSRGLRFEEVSFDYEVGVPTVRDLNLVVEAGETTAIVGPSGSGKSTVADLVMGLLVPTAGRILVDNEPLEGGHVNSWRERIGYVAQDTFLFNDTVRANLLWACPGAGDEEIRRVLRMAAAEEFVDELPDGQDTMLGDRGVRLSGGEKQRLALARALLRNPSLLILDEATSALDSENEKRIQDAIEKLHGRVTILVITHRLATVRGADTIHVLEKGRIVESGSWEALLGKENGRFGTLCAAQGISMTARLWTTT